MDLTNSIPTKTPHTENETSPQTQPIKPLSFTDGAVLKNHHPRPPALVVTYRECLKNHAASLGGHALDGCGEFMSSPTANASDPTSLKCAACGCHRNFHRRDPDDSITTTHFLDFHRSRPPPRRNSPSPSPPLPPPYYSSAPHMLLALSTAVPEEQQAMNHHPVATPVTPTAVKAENSSGRKRFRTKFSQEQKEKMLSFSEKLGWKLQKCDEGLVEEFCNDVGIGKGVLKVWMHNNKNTFGKRDITTTTTTTTITTTNNNSSNISNGRVSFENNGYNININNNNDDNSHHDHNESNSAHLHVSNNGSSSSS